MRSDARRERASMLATLGNGRSTRTRTGALRVRGSTVAKHTPTSRQRGSTNGPRRSIAAELGGWRALRSNERRSTVSRQLGLAAEPSRSDQAAVMPCSGRRPLRLSLVGLFGLGEQSALGGGRTS